MTARITGFVTRADAGLGRPRSVSHNVKPERGGVALHYGGPPQPCAVPGAAHALCVKTWLDWWRFHTGPERGWADLAYSGGFCNHGYAFAGRGLGVRTAANGTNDGNDRFLAFVWLGGDGQTPTAGAYDAAEWWVAESRSAGAGTAVKSHRFFKSTACAGTHVSEHAYALDNQPLSSLPPTTSPKEIDMLIVDDPGSEPDGSRQWICDTHSKRHAASWDEVLGLLRVGVPHLEEDPATAAQRAAILSARVEVKQ